MVSTDTLKEHLSFLAHVTTYEYMLHTPLLGCMKGLTYPEAHRLLVVCFFKK